MTKEEYIRLKNELNEEFKERLRDLGKKFALSNNDVKVGDIVSDRCNTIRVEEICVSGLLTTLPKVYYYGTRLTKNLEPFNSEYKACVSNVKNHIRKEKSHMLYQDKMNDEHLTMDYHF